MSGAEFRALFAAVSNWGRWGADDERGTLNYLTADRIAAAARLATTGQTVTLSLPLKTEREPHNPEPAEHRMTMLADTDVGSGTLRFAKDYVGVDFHNDGHSHIDALCHVAYEGRSTTASRRDSVTPEGAPARHDRGPQGRPRRPRRAARRPPAARRPVARAGRARLRRGSRGRPSARRA